METRDLMHVETELATPCTTNVEIIPATTSPAYRSGDPGLYSFQSDPINHIELMHYVESGYGHNPVLYRPLSVFPHPAGYRAGMAQFYTGGGMANATTFLPDQAQINSIQQPFYGNPISVGHNLPVVYHSQGQSIGFPAAYNLIPNAVQTGNLYHPEQLSGSLPPWNTNYGFPGYSTVHHVASSHQNLVGGSLNSSYAHSWPGMIINPGMMHGINPRANLTPSNVPVPQGHSQQHLPVPDSRAPSLKHHLDARHINEDSNRCTGDPTAGSRPLSHSHAGLSHMDLAMFSRMGLTNTSLTRIPNEQISFQLQHGHENIIRMLPTEPSAVPPTVWARESINMENPSGKRSQAQRTHLNHLNQTSVPLVRRNTKQTASAANQVSWRKTWTWPSNRLYKPSKENVYHISWDGLETSCQPVGLNCGICNADLGYAPANIESKPPVLPEVSVLSCGHAFHTECFQPVILEPSADPPCYICALGKP